MASVVAGAFGSQVGAGGGHSTPRLPPQMHGRVRCAEHAWQRAYPGTIPKGRALCAGEKGLAPGLTAKAYPGRSCLAAGTVAALPDSDAFVPPTSRLANSKPADGEFDLAPLGFKCEIRTFAIS